MKNKSQIRVQEMAFMIVGIFIFFILAGLFAFAIFYTNIQKDIRSVKEAQAISSVTNLASSPEFACTGLKTNCIDSDKLIALFSNENYLDFYSDFLSLDVIKSNAFKKNERDMILCTSENYPNCDKFSFFSKNSSLKKIPSFVTLCRIENENYINYEKCEVAKIVAGV